MVPGLGLYLDELFFDKYNLKLKYDDEKRQRHLEKRKNQQTEINDEGERVETDVNEENNNEDDEEKEDTSISVITILSSILIILYL